MIFDSIKNAKQYYCLGEKFQKAFEFLINSDLKNIKDGKHIIDNDRIYASVQTLTTKTKEEKKFEAHREYIDIQYVIKGSETMGFGLLDDFSKVVVEYDKNKDLVFLDGEKYSYVNVKEGEFTIFFPNDVHAPMLAFDKPCEIKKVIVKIAL